MSYIDEKSLEEFSKCVVTLIEENTADNENIFTDSYCKSTCNAYLNKTYTADTFPFRYHINDNNNNIYIDGISVAGISETIFLRYLIVYVYPLIYSSKLLSTQIEPFLIRLLYIILSAQQVLFAHRSNEYVKI